MNNLGSCELDEDDLMLDLEFLEEQHHHRAGKTEKYWVSSKRCCYSRNMEMYSVRLLGNIRVISLER